MKKRTRMALLTGCALAASVSAAMPRIEFPLMIDDQFDGFRNHADEAAKYTVDSQYDATAQTWSLKSLATISHAGPDWSVVLYRWNGTAFKATAKNDFTVGPTSLTQDSREIDTVSNAFKPKVVRMVYEYNTDGCVTSYRQYDSLGKTDPFMTMVFHRSGKGLPDSTLMDMSMSTVQGGSMVIVRSSIKTIYSQSDGLYRTRETHATTSMGTTVIPGRVTQSVYTYGAGWVTVVSKSKANPSAQEWVNNDSVYYEVDNEGRILKQFSHGWNAEGNAWFAVGNKTTYTYAGGVLAENLYSLIQSGGTLVPSSKTTYYYTPYAGTLPPLPATRISAAYGTMGSSRTLRTVDISLPFGNTSGSFSCYSLRGQFIGKPTLTSVPMPLIRGAR